MPRATYTDEQLRAAYRQRRLHTWPDTFEAAMADPTLANLIRIEARLAEHRAERAQQRQRPAPLWPANLRPPTLDHKRLAAGERPED